MSSNTRSMLDQELTQLHDDLIRLGGLVDEAIAHAVQALKERNTELAQQVVVGDQAINNLRYHIEETAIITIATQQPMAGDLRKLIAGTHIAVELERMGDHAEGIAALVLRMSDQPLLKPLVDIPRMAEIDREMIRESLEAFTRCDADAARQLAQRDNEVDSLYDQVFRELLTYMVQDPKVIERATFLLWVAHNLERIGDRATNISERIIFMTTGKIQELNS